MQSNENTVPTILDITWDEFVEAYETWVVWVATGRKYLPTELRKQPQPLFGNMLYIDMLFERIVAQQRDRLQDT